MKKADEFRRLAGAAHMTEAAQRAARAIVDSELERMRYAAARGDVSAHVAFDVLASSATKQAVAAMLRDEGLLVVWSSEFCDSLHVSWGSEEAKFVARYVADEEPEEAA